MKTIVFNLNDELYTALKNEADESGTTVEEYLPSFIEETLYGKEVDDVADYI